MYDEGPVRFICNRCLVVRKNSYKKLLMVKISVFSRTLTQIDDIKLLFMSIRWADWFRVTLRYLTFSLGASVQKSVHTLLCHRPYKIPVAPAHVRPRIK